jgi:hypothetical protein
MSDWTLAQAKLDFNRGLLKDVRIVSAMPGTWSVEITSTLALDGKGWLLGAKKKEPRQMKTLDAALEAVLQIGFEVKQLLVER